MMRHSISVVSVYNGQGSLKSWKDRGQAPRSHLEGPNALPRHSARGLSHVSKMRHYIVHGLHYLVHVLHYIVHGLHCMVHMLHYIMHVLHHIMHGLHYIAHGLHYGRNCAFMHFTRHKTACLPVFSLMPARAASPFHGAMRCGR